jgi:hypothetical protein
MTHKTLPHCAAASLRASRAPLSRCAAARALASATACASLIRGTSSCSRAAASFPLCCVCAAGGGRGGRRCARCLRAWSAVTRRMRRRTRWQLRGVVVALRSCRCCARRLRSCGRWCKHARSCASHLRTSAQRSRTRRRAATIVLWPARLLPRQRRRSPAALSRAHRTACGPEVGQGRATLAHCHCPMLPDPEGPVLFPYGGLQVRTR